MNSSRDEFVEKEDLLFAVYSRRTDGVIVLHLQDDVFIDITKAEAMSAALGRITAGKPRRILVMNGRFTSADSAARKLLSSEQKKLHVEKVAVTIYSLSQKLLANFFMRVNKPPYPIRFFNSPDEAEAWLLND